MLEHKISDTAVLHELLGSNLQGCFSRRDEGSPATCNSSTYSEINEDKSDLILFVWTALHRYTKAITSVC